MDWAGSYGIQLGATVRHIDNSEADYSKVNFKVLGEMIAVRLQPKKEKIDVATFVQRINSLKAKITNGHDGYAVKDTMSVFGGFEGTGGTEGGRLFSS